MRTRRRSLALAGTASALLASVVVGGAAAPALATPAKSARYTPCIYPDGTNIQEKYGVTVSLVLPLCPEIKAGAAWAVGIGWYSAKTWEQMPAGYVPTSATPLDDFRANFVSARWVIDEGTPQQFTVDWANGPRLWIGSDGTYDIANAMTLGTIRPLPVGAHTVRRSLVLSALTCDGMSEDPSVSCLPAGEAVADTLSFRVVP